MPSSPSLSSSSSSSSSFFPSPNYPALGFGQQTRQTPAPQCLRVSLYLFPVIPLDPLSAGNSPIFGSGGEGRGLPAPRSPRAQSSASRMAAELRAGRGQQVRGYAWRSSRGPAGHQLGSEQPLGPAPPRLRPRPTLSEAPPLPPSSTSFRQLRGSAWTPQGSCLPSILPPICGPASCALCGPVLPAHSVPDPCKAPAAGAYITLY